MSRRIPRADAATGIDAGSLAWRLDCFTEDEVQVLSGVQLSTLEAWRKRGTGPGFVRFGNRVLYPRIALSDFFARRTASKTGSGKDLL